MRRIWLRVGLLPIFCAALAWPAVATAKTQRSRVARGAFKREHPCPSKGKSRGGCPGYVIDHIRPLKRGGADVPPNMQWQTKADAKAKDRWE